MAIINPLRIQQPFANAGDVQIVPQTDPSAYVNFNLGYTPDYEINLASGNPAAKAVERPIMNWMFNLLTSNVQAWQQLGFPQWYNDMAGGYSINAVVVRLNGTTWTPYRSLVNNNVTDPLSSPLSWEYIQAPHEILANVSMPQGGSGGTGTAIITGAKDFNTIGTGSWQLSSDAVAASCPNAPAVLGQSPLAGFLQSMQWTVSGNTYGAQLYMDRTSQIFVRGMTNGSWANWRNLFAAPNVYVVNELRIWAGTATQAAVTAAWGPGWHLADGTNGTIDMRDRFVVGQSSTKAANTTGGADTVTLSTANLPSHNHAVTISDPTHNHGINQTPHAHGVNDPAHNHYVNDPTHTHSLYDPGHNHGVNDPGHSHSMPYLGSVQAGGDNGGAQCPVNTGYTSGRPQQNVNGSGTGIFLSASGTGMSVYANYTGIYLSGSQTGISIQAQYANVSNIASGTGITASTANVGSGTAVTIVPKYYSFCLVQYTGA